MTQRVKAIQSTQRQNLHPRAFCFWFYSVSCWRCERRCFPFFFPTGHNEKGFGIPIGIVFHPASIVNLQIGMKSGSVKISSRMGNQAWSSLCWRLRAQPPSCETGELGSHICHRVTLVLQWRRSVVCALVALPAFQLWALNLGPVIAEPWSTLDSIICI